MAGQLYGIVYLTWLTSYKIVTSLILTPVVSEFGFEGPWRIVLRWYRFT